MAAGAFDEKALRAFCRAQLAIHKIPKTFACVPALPKTQEDPDVLHVTRTWQFLPGGELIDR